jgi:ubiquinone biosynthesis protein Coq4
MAPLLPVHWEDRWHQDIGDFRREFGIRPAPTMQ